MPKLKKLKKIKCDFFGDFQTLCAILTNNGKTVLPDRSLLIGQKLVKMPNFENSHATFLMIFKHCYIIFINDDKKEGR